MVQFELAALLQATLETIYIVFISSTCAVIFGLAIGLVLFLTAAKQPLENRWIHRILSLVVNITRSIPFIILMISILPLTRWLVGTTIGSNAAIVPLALAAIPFFARICENAFFEVQSSLLETAHAFGATTYQLVQKVLLPESLPLLIRGATLTVIALVGYSAMAGVVGGGGLGELAINYGYQRFNAFVTTETVIVLVMLVAIIQWYGDLLAKRRKVLSCVVAACVIGVACVVFQLWPWVHGGGTFLRVGVISGWPEEVMKVAQQVAKDQYHLNIKIVTFNDYVLPNTALVNGNIDANIFQHEPYLEAQIVARGFPLASIGKTFVYPMGFYSRKIHALSELKSGATIAIPNDPSNEARALLLLQKSGLITLDQHALSNASVRDITSNTRHFKFKTLDAAQLPRVFKDVDLVGLTNDFVGPAHFTLDEALLKEGADSLYANIIVVRKSEQNDDRLQALVAVMHSQAVLEETQRLFPHGAAIPAW